MNDRQLSVDFIAEPVGISTGTSQSILTREYVNENSLHDVLHVIRRSEGGLH